MPPPSFFISARRWRYIKRPLARPWRVQIVLQSD
jgi:hypothetical protein